MSPILCDLTKHPVPDEITPELLSSITVPPLNNWINAKGITVGVKARRSEKEAAFLHSIAAEKEPFTANAKLSPAAEEHDDVSTVDVELDVIASAINHIRKKMKTEQYDKAVIETVKVSQWFCTV